VTSAGVASVEASHADEVRSAVAWLEHEARPGGLVVVGHCTGARSAVTAAADDRRVRGVVAWAIPLGTDADRAAPEPGIEAALAGVTARSIPALWAFGTRDPAWRDFRSYLERLPETPRRWTIHTVASANHDFTAAAWTRELVDATVGWMAASTELMGGRGKAAWTSV
jgi:dienelactone hydrolase